MQNLKVKLFLGSTPYVSVFAGGLLICLPKEAAEAFCTEIAAREGFQAWFVGEVEPGDRTARIVETPHLIEVEERYYEPSTTQ